MENIELMMNEIGQNARQCQNALAKADAKSKQNALIGAADKIWARRSEILEANQKDMEFGREKGLSAAMMDRLMLDEARVQSMVDGIRAIAEFPDPIGEVTESWTRPNGLEIKRVRTPLGVIGVIFESRPNVTADAAALCLKSGNAVILRCGSESFHSSTTIHAAMVEGIVDAGLPSKAVQLIPTRDRTAVQKLLTMVEHVDVIVPRGGKGLVGLVQREARVPVFAHLEGVVHLFVDKDADPQKALDVVLNAKTRRTGICGALECLLIDAAYRKTHGDAIIEALMAAGMEVRGDASFQSIEGVVAAQDEDWGKEFNDAIIAVKQVEDLNEAIDFIQNNHSMHTDGILTENEETAHKFFAELDSAILTWNASTQFADGGEFGMGAEIGIATGKLHARGPVGATQLTSFKYIVKGDGTTRP